MRSALSEVGYLITIKLLFIRLVFKALVSVNMTSDNINLR